MIDRRVDDGSVKDQMMLHLQKPIGHFSSDFSLSDHIQISQITVGPFR
jgi:hypothetical protein